MVEQNNPGAQSAGQQKLYPIAGGLARTDSTGIQKVILDNGSGVSAQTLIQLSNILGGI